MRRVILSSITLALAACSVGTAAEPRLGPARTFLADAPWRGGFAQSDAALIPGGRALVVGRGSTPRMTDGVLVRTRASARGPWRTIGLARVTDGVEGPVASLHPDGSGLVAYANGAVLWASRGSLTGTWSRPASVVRLAVSDRGSRLFSGMAPDGTASIVYVRSSSCGTVGTTCWTVSVFRQAAAAASWTPGPQLDIVADRPLSVDVSDSGHVALAWTAPSTPSGVMPAAPTISTAALAPSESAFARGAVPVPELPAAIGIAAGDRGESLLAWTTQTGEIRAADRPAGGAWATATPVPAPGPVSSFAGVQPLIAADGTRAIAYSVGEGTPTGSATRWGVVATRSGSEGAFTAQSVIDAGAGNGVTPTPAASVTGASDRPLVTGSPAAFGWISRVGASDDSRFFTWRDQAGTWRRTVATARPSYRPVMAWAADGTALIADSGGIVRNLDTVVTPPPPRIITPRVRVTGRSATLSMSVDVPVTVWIRRSGPIRAGRMPVATDSSLVVRRRGAVSRSLGVLRPGRYRVEVVACHPTRGCTSVMRMVRIA